MMLWFVGTGLADAHSMTEQAKNAISDADAVFVEGFTSPSSEKYLEEIRQLARGRMHEAKRWMVEDGSKILESAKNGTAVLVSRGDSYAATTHIELRARAASEGIKTRTAHGASIMTALVGECGMHQYKVGKSSTIMQESGQFTTPYYTVYKNLINGAHTILLLEYNQDKGYFLNPGKAIQILQDAEKSQRRGVIRDDTFCIVASRIGADDQSIVSGKISSLTEKEFGAPPHALLVPGSMHFTESDALKVLAECIDEPSDNSKSTPSISRQMLEKYVPMIEQAILDARKLCGKDARFDEVLDGAQRYSDDAKRFLEDGQEELAVLCIGYADGLADSVRIANGLEPAGAKTEKHPN